MTTGDEARYKRHREEKPTARYKSMTKLKDEEEVIVKKTTKAVKEEKGLNVDVGELTISPLRMDAKDPTKEE